MAAREHLEVALEPLRDAAGAPRWGAPARWHLTLLFLGAVPDDRVPPLTVAAGTVVAGAPAMTLRLAGTGRFGSVRRPQVFWAGLDGDVAPLVELAAGLAAVARDLRLPHPDGGILEVSAPPPPHMRESFAFFGFEAPRTPKPRHLSPVSRR